MAVLRRVVFPALRIVIWAVIAVALVKLAFAGETLSASADVAHATGSVTEPTVQVTAATVTNTVSVAGSVVADAAVPVKATAAGTVASLYAKDGDTVAVGARLLSIRTQTAVDPVTTTDPATGATTTTQPKPAVTLTTVTAGVAGTLALPTLKDQAVSVGDVVARVTPGTLSVSGRLTADQQYRLVGAPTNAQVALKGGPAPFTCTGLRIGAAAATGTGTGTGTDDADTSGATTTGTVTCAIPAGVTAFAGLGATIAITNGQASGPVVPVTAVQGSVQKGNVWVVAGGGDPTERSVGLGLTDGEQVQITDGLTAGDTVLQFVPVVDSDTDCSSPPATPTDAWIKACGAG